MTSDGRDALYRLAYDEAIRALSGQQVLIESLRARAGLLLSAAAVTTSFLGSQALGGDPNAIGWLSLVVFAAVSGTCIAVLWPRRWELAVNSGSVIRSLLREPLPTTSELLESLSIYAHQSYLRNEVGLEKLGDLLQLAGSLLCLDVAIWMIAVAV